MNITLKKDINSIKTGDTYCFFITEEQAASDWISKIHQPISDAISYIDIASVSGKHGECFYIPLVKVPSLIVCGLGKIAELKSEGIRKAGAALAFFCASKNITSISCITPSPGTFVEAECARFITEGIALSNYKFEKFKTKDKANKLIETLHIYSNDPLVPDIIREIQIIYKNTALCRDIVNDASYNSTPTNIAAAAKAMTSDKRVKCQIFGKKQIEEMKMGLLLAVNQGSLRPPQLVVLTYKGAPDDKRSIALVGKGLTFDSGGINLKTSGNIENMRMDMAGAAAVMFAFKSAVELNIKKNIYAVMPLTENMIGPDAYRAGDVFKAYNGLTVEIGNTDAEGRLILADALAYTVAKLKPTCIIDMATLTGACVTTFGETVAGLVSTDEELTSKLRKAADETGERLWPLPLYSDYAEDMKSDIADIRNTSSEKNAGTIRGAAFLKNFTGTTPWAHIDIAGTAWYTKPRGYMPKNATGYGIRLLVDFLREW
ncbi:MAG: leucyl aminopeptidase [Leptospirales bacterium]|nr:leucyl aminopeptidase [Leptospirales bacterium]